MNRWLLRGNAALFVCLVVLLVVNARATFARTDAGLATSAVRWIGLTGDRAAGGRTSGVIDFATLMVPLERLDDPVPPGLAALEPTAKAALRWSSPSQLRVDTLEPLARATTYRVHLDPALRTLDGRKLDPKLGHSGTQGGLTFETERLRIEQMTAEEDKDGAFVALAFDLPVALDAVQKALSVRDEAGKPLAFRSVEQRADPARSAFRIRLDQKPAGAVVVRLDKTLTPAGKPLDLGNDHERKLSFTEPLAVLETRVAHGRIEIDFNHALELPAKESIRITPAVAFQVQTDGAALELHGEWKAGSTLAIELDAGFPGQGRHRLATRRRISVRVPDLHPAISFASPGSVLSRLARPEIEVRGVNVARYEVSARTVYPNNLVHLVQAARNGIFHDATEVFAPESKKTLLVDAARNEPFTQRLDLADLLGGKPAGLHEVALRDLDGDSWCAERRLVQVTDLGLSVRASGDSIAVRVRSLARGSAVLGAYVRVLTPTNQDLCSAPTDADGIVVLRYARTAADRRPFLVLASTGDDVACVDFAGFAVQLAGDDLAGRPFLEEGVEAQVLLDRGAVRPGEKVHATLLVRDGSGRAPAGLRLEARLYSPARTLAQSVRLHEEGHGLVSWSHALSPDAATGAWRIDVVAAGSDAVLGSAPFRVDAFVPDRLEVSGKAEGLRSGEEAAVAVTGRWLEGTPAAGLEVRARIRLEAGSTKPKGLEQFSFAPLDPEPPPGELPDAKAVLNDKGEALVTFLLPPQRTLQLLQARIGLELQDPSGRPSRGALVVPVAPAAGLVGVRAAPGTAECEAPAGAQVVLRLERRRWTWRAATSGGRGFHYECRVVSELLEEQALIGAGTVRWQHPPEPDSWLVVSARLGEQLAEASVGDAPLRPDTLRVTARDERMRPGGDARVRVDAPVAGSAFVTVESTTIHAAFTRPIAAGSNELAVPIPADLAVPNVHVVVTLTTAQARAGAAGPFWICGAASVALAHEERGTAVTLQADERVAPEGKVRLKITAPGATRASVALVDEGILRLTQHPSPDPLAFFLGRRTLHGRGADSGTSLLQDARFDPGVRIGGDDDSHDLGGRLAGSITSTIETVALWSAPVCLDAHGEAECAFDLPPYEGRLRAVVVAAGPRVVGAATAKIVVAGPLGLRLATPRHMAPGDEALCVVTLRNSTGAAGKVALALHGEGGALLAAGEPATREIEIPDGKTATTLVRVAAGGEVGIGALVAEAVLGPERRLTRQRFDVRPAVPYTSATIGIALQGRQTLTVPDGWLPGTARLVLAVDGEPSARLLPLLTSLVRYPYGCAEQTTSRAFALLACAALLPRVCGDGTPPDAALLVQEAIDRLLTMRTHDGGIATWPGSRSASPFCSAYVLELWQAARAGGFAVPEEAFHALAEHVARSLAREQDHDQLFFAVLALAGTGHPIRGWLARLADEAVTEEQRTMLGLAFARLADAESAKAMLAERATATAAGMRAGQAGTVQAASTAGAAQAAASKTYGSDPRTRAWLLRALLAAAPSDPRIPALAQRLLRDALAPAELATQAQAQVLLALAEHDRVRGAQGAPVRASLTAAGRRFELDRKKPLVLELRGSELLELASEAVLYGSLEISGFRARAEAVTSPDLLLTRELRLADGKPQQGPLVRGAACRIVLGGKTSRRIDDLLLTVYLPAGLELDGQEPVLTVEQAGEPKTRTVRLRSESRDDRVLAFVTEPVAGAFTLTLHARAAFAGRFAHGPALAEALYEPGLRCTTPLEEPLAIEATAK